MTPRSTSLESRTTGRALQPHEISFLRLAEALEAANLLVLVHVLDEVAPDLLADFPWALSAEQTGAPAGSAAPQAVLLRKSIRIR